MTLVRKRTGLGEFSYRLDIFERDKSWKRVGSVKYAGVQKLHQALTDAELHLNGLTPKSGERPPAR